MKIVTVFLVLVCSWASAKGIHQPKRLQPRFIRPASIRQQENLEIISLLTMADRHRIMHHIVETDITETEPITPEDEDFDLKIKAIEAKLTTFDASLSEDHWYYFITGDDIEWTDCRWMDGIDQIHRCDDAFILAPILDHPRVTKHDHVLPLARVTTKWLKSCAGFLASTYGTDGNIVNTALAYLKLKMAEVILAFPGPLMSCMLQGVGSCIVDSEGNKSWISILKSIVQLSSAGDMWASERAPYERILERLIATLVRLSDPIKTWIDVRLAGTVDSNAVENGPDLTFIKEMGRISYFLGGIRAAFYSIYHDDVGRAKARKSYYDALIAVALTPVVISFGPEMILVGAAITTTAKELIKNGANMASKSVIDGECQEAYREYVDSTSSFRDIFKRIIHLDTDVGLHAFTLFLPIYNNVGTLQPDL